MSEFLEIKPDEFDTALYGFPVAKVGLAEALSPHDKELSGIVAELVANLAKQEFQYSTIRLPLEKNWALIHALEENGFRSVDMIIALSMQLAILTPKKPTVTIRDAIEADIPSLSQLAGETFRYSRVFNDPRLDSGLGKEFHRRWVANSVRGYADRVLVSVTGNDTPSGFATLKRDKDTQGLGHIPLIGVDRDNIGQGIGRQLTNAALLIMRNDWGCDRAEIETQLTNIPAIRSYQASGFKPIGAYATLAWHK